MVIRRTCRPRLVEDRDGLRSLRQDLVSMRITDCLAAGEGPRWDPRRVRIVPSGLVVP